MKEKNSIRRGSSRVRMKGGIARYGIIGQDQRFFSRSPLLRGGRSALVLLLPLFNATQHSHRSRR